MAQRTCTIAGCDKAQYCRSLCRMHYNHAAYVANRDAMKARAKQWYEDNRDRARGNMRAYYEANREDGRGRARAWYEANRETVITQSREWREANPDRPRQRRAENRERFRERDRAHYAANREKVLERVARRDAAIRGSVVKPVDYGSLPHDACGICDGPLDFSLRWPDPQSPSIDHIVPIAKGGSHTQENLQWACLVCNLRKGDRIPDTDE